MKFNSNQERQAYWEEIIQQYSPAQIESALNTLHRDTARVIQLHYLYNHPLKEIGPIINRSMTVVRNHHNRGIVKLHKYFSNVQK